MDSFTDEIAAQLKKKPEIGSCVDRCIHDEPYIIALFEIIGTDKTSIKFYAEKIIHTLSETDPDLLYRHLDKIAVFIDSPNHFIQWGFIGTLANLIRSDENKICKSLIDRFVALMDSSSLVTSANAIAGTPAILHQYPEYETIILPKLLSVDSHIYLHRGEVSPECNHVAKGHIIDCFIRIYPASHYKNEIHDFVLRNQEDSRNQVRVIARKFLMKYFPKGTW